MLVKETDEKARERWRNGEGISMRFLSIRPQIFLSVCRDSYALDYFVVQANFFEKYWEGFKLNLYEGKPKFFLPKIMILSACSVDDLVPSIENGLRFKIFFGDPETWGSGKFESSTYISVIQVYSNHENLNLNLTPFVPWT